MKKTDSGFYQDEPSDIIWDMVIAFGMAITLAMALFGPYFCN